MNASDNRDDEETKKNSHSWIQQPDTGPSRLLARILLTIENLDHVTTRCSKVCTRTNDEDGWTTRSWERRPLVIGVGVIPVGAAGQRSRGTRIIRAWIHELVRIHRPTGRQETGNAISFGSGGSRYRGTRAARRLLLDKDWLPATGSSQTSLPGSWITGSSVCDWYHAKDEVVDGWKGGDTVNGRSSRVGVAKGHRRSRGQLVRRVKGFQDWEQVDRSRQDRHVPACFPAFPTRASLVSLDATCVDWITRRSSWLMTTWLFYSHNRQLSDTANDCWLVLEFSSIRSKCPRARTTVFRFLPCNSQVKYDKRGLLKSNNLRFWTPCII